jgi:hypothetical protein
LIRQCGRDDGGPNNYNSFNTVVGDSCPKIVVLDTNEYVKTEKEKQQNSVLFLAKQLFFLLSFMGLLDDSQWIQAAYHAVNEHS